MNKSQKVIVKNGMIGGITRDGINTFVDKFYRLWRTLSKESSFLVYQPKHLILNKIIFSLALIASGTTSAATSDELAMHMDTDKVTKVTVAENNWIILENNPINGVTRVRDYYDMGASGLQQIDYVVNCTNQKLALAGFAVIPTIDAKYHISNNRNYADLSFYKPVIQHDKNIIGTACRIF
jgi:hypothetical protein